MTILEIIGELMLILFDGFNQMWETLFRINLPTTANGTPIYIFTSLGDIILFFIYLSLFVSYLFRIVKGVGDSD